MSYGTYSGHDTDFYETTDAVAETVNLAIKLQRPILVEGEPGCGKTLLARSIAAELSLGEPIGLRIKSTTQAKDLLYRFDALRRLQEVQNPNRVDQSQYTYPYISLQPLGTAIHDGKPCVVLIDEIDKADIDFPNDLLDVLDEFAFDIEELPAAESDLCLTHRGFGRRVMGTTSIKPIVVITSNREKQLPEPFLRRCLFLELQFPKDPKQLAIIVRKNLGPKADLLASKLVEAAVRKFMDVREKTKAIGADQKPPATSELIDWVRILHWRQTNPDEIALSNFKPPYYRTLFKTASDLRKFEGQTD
jgi:MoxR-like ATPase